MIVRPRPPIWKLFFVIRGSIVPRILVNLVVIALISISVVWVHHFFPSRVPLVDGSSLSIVGIAIAVFLAFRNNVSYDRWWEGRRLWGHLIHLSRTFSRQTLLLRDGRSNRADLLRPIGEFACAMVDHLRATNRSPSEPNKASPDVVLMRVSIQLAELRRAQTISDIEFQILDRSIGEMGSVLAGCERIRNTPVPLAYSLLMHRTAYLFCIFFPFGYAEVLGWATPLISTLIAYTFFGLSALGDELEEPFGLEPNDLPIAAMANAIVRSIAADLGEAPPPVLEPVGFVLR